MEPNFETKNAGARVCVYDKYITLKANFLAKDVMIPLKEISSVENGLIHLEINTKDKRSYKIALKRQDKQKVVDMIRDQMID